MAELSTLGLILTLLDPEYARGADIVRVVGENRRLLKPAIKLAERNGLYYFLMRTLKEFKIDMPFASEKRWQEENRGLERLKNTIALLNSISGDCGVNYIWIKSCHPIMHIPRDVDILLKREERRRFIRALEEKGMQYDRCDIQTVLDKEGLLRIDIYNEINYFNKRFIEDAFLWSSVSQVQLAGIPYPALNREADFLLMLAHSLFNHRSMTLLDFLHMKSLRSCIDVDTCREHTLNDGWGAVFDLSLEEFDNVYRRIYEEGAAVKFPYIFDTGFVLKCVAMTDGLSLSRLNWMFLPVYLGLVRLRESQKDTSLYRLLRSFEPTRRLLNNCIKLLRIMRGDKVT